METPWVIYLTCILHCRLKREILLALVRGTLWPEDASKKEELLCKYEKFILPEEVSSHPITKFSNCLVLWDIRITIPSDRRLARS